MNEWTYHCRILGVPKDATPVEIKSAYMAQAKLFHPDKHQNDSIAKQKFQQLQESYNYLKKNNKAEAFQQKSHQQPVEKLQSQKIWIFISAICLIAIAGLIVLWPNPKPPIIQKQTPAISSEDIENVLAKSRLFIFKMGSTQEKCSLLSRENANYHDLVAATERFTNTGCGDVRAFFDKSDMKKLFIISPTQESCQCQVDFLKNKPELKANKTYFNDSDLQ